MKLNKVLFISTFLLVGCNANEIVKVEDENSYLWQKYMNEEEFKQLKVGIAYMDVVKIAGGPGELIESDEEAQREVYRWNDEILVTQAYEIVFENNALQSMEMIERKGTSKRGIEEKKPAVPGS